MKQCRKQADHPAQMKQMQHSASKVTKYSSNYTVSQEMF